MSEKAPQIITAAGDLFSRYGIGRTTMSDIAQAAGVARQTLYNAYPNKEELMRAVVRQSIAHDMGQVAAEWADQTDLGGKIDSYFAHGPLAWYDLVLNSPDAAEMIDGLNNTAKAEVDAAMTQWRGMFSSLFADAGTDDPDTMADFFVAASKSAKYDATDRQTLEKRLAMLKSATLAMLQS